MVFSFLSRNISFVFSFLSNLYCQFFVRINQFFVESSIKYCIYKVYSLLLYIIFISSRQSFLLSSFISFLSFYSKPPIFTLLTTFTYNLARHRSLLSVYISFLSAYTQLYVSILSVDCLHSVSL